MIKRYLDLYERLISLREREVALLAQRVTSEIEFYAASAAKDRADAARNERVTALVESDLLEIKGRLTTLNMQLATRAPEDKSAAGNTAETKETL